MAKDISPDTAVDRDKEQQEFSNLLVFQDESRLLIIQDEAETGKTILLQRLHYNCQWVEIPAKAAGLVDLEEKEITSEFAIIERIRQSLQQLNFKTFDKLNRARINKESTAFRGPISIDLRDASVTGGQVNATGLAISQTGGGQQTINVGATPWSEEHEELAKQECIQAFFQDLKVIADQQPVILLLDSFDKLPNKELQVWIRNSLALPLCLDVARRPAQLILVVAGRELPGLMLLLNHATYGKLIRSKSLSSWSDEHVEAFLKLHGYQNLSEEEMKQLVGLAKIGRPIGFLLKMADLYNQYRKT